MAKPKRHELSEAERAQIVLLASQGMSQQKISKTLKHSRAAVQYALRLYRETGEYISKPRPGRKRKSSAREDRILARESLKNRQKTSSELAASLQERQNVTLSARTVRRRLTEAGLRGCKARKKPWLSEENKKRRLEWAKLHKDWSHEDWSNVVWSDEANFEVSKLHTSKNKIKSGFTKTLDIFLIKVGPN